LKKQEWLESEFNFTNFNYLPVALHNAIEKQDIEKVRVLLKNNQDSGVLVDLKIPLNDAETIAEKNQNQRNEVYELVLRWQKERELDNNSEPSKVLSDWYYDPFAESEHLSIGKEKVTIFEWLVVRGEDGFLEQLLLDPNHQADLQNAVKNDNQILQRAFEKKQRLISISGDKPKAKDIFDAIDIESPWQIAWYLKAEKVDPFTSKTQAKYQGKEASLNVFEYYFTKKHELGFADFYKKYGQAAPFDQIFPSLKSQLIEEWKKSTNFDWTTVFWPLMSDSEKKEMASGSSEQNKIFLQRTFLNTSDKKYFPMKETKVEVKKEIEEKLEVKKPEPEQKKIIEIQPKTEPNILSSEAREKFNEILDSLIKRIDDKKSIKQEHINDLNNNFPAIELVKKDKDLKKKLNKLMKSAVKLQLLPLLNALFEKGVSKEKALCQAVKNIGSYMVTYSLNSGANPNCDCLSMSPLAQISKELKKAGIDNKNLDGYKKISKKLLKKGAYFGQKHKLITASTTDLDKAPQLYEWEFAGFKNRDDWFKFIGINEAFLDPDQNKSGIAFTGKLIYKDYESAVTRLEKKVSAGKKITPQEREAFFETVISGFYEKDEKTTSLWLNAFKNQDYEFLRVLFKKGVVDKDELLNYAVEQNNVAFAKELVAAGAKLRTIEDLVTKESNPQKKEQYRKVLVELMNPADAIFDSYEFSGKVKTNDRFLNQNEFESKFAQITKENVLNIKSNASERPLLIVVVQFLDLNHIKQLLDKGIDFDVLVDGTTPLFEACYRGRNDVVKSLLTKTNNMPKTINTAVGGETPLQRAVGNSDVALVELLLNSGAKPNIHNALYTGVATHKWLRDRNPQDNFEKIKTIIKMLLEHGADYGKKDYRKTIEDETRYPEWEVLGFTTKEAWFKDLGVDVTKVTGKDLSATE